MNLKIISTDKTLYDGNISKVSLPGDKGNFTILNNHASLISNLTNGQIVYYDKKDKTTIDIIGGLVKVNQNNIIVLIED